MHYRAGTFASNLLIGEHSHFKYVASYEMGYGLVTEILLKYFAGMIISRVETGSGHPGHPGHVLPGSTGSDLLYKISGSDPDSA